MVVDKHLTERARGAMIGLAVGDALGMPTQSMSAMQIVEYYGGSIHSLMDAVPQQPIAPNMSAGSVTDDTEQAFVLANRLIEDGGRIDNDAYAQDLLRWEARMKARGSLDLLGPSTKAALQALTDGVAPEHTGQFGTTNGGAMRATPVGIAFRPGESLAEEAWRSCVVTHNTVQGIESTISDDEFAVILRRDCGTSVEANESVAAAFAIATRFFDRPTEALCFAASLGGDTDTIAAITGAMLGAWRGADGFDQAIVGQVLRRLKDDNRLDVNRTVAGLLALREREG